jgi:ribonuclease-3 family protein
MDPFLINVLTLAYQGDAVYERMVRRALITRSPQSAGKMHRMAMNYVSAANQSRACEVLIPLLNENETSVFMRARNASSPHMPKHADVADYHRATALEAVFGYLDLMNNQDRIEDLFLSVFEFLSSQKDK